MTECLATSRTLPCRPHTASEGWPCEPRKILRASRQRARQGKACLTVARTAKEKEVKLCQFHQECDQPAKTRTPPAKAEETIPRAASEKVITLSEYHKDCQAPFAKKEETRPKSVTIPRLPKNVEVTVTENHKKCFQEYVIDIKPKGKVTATEVRIPKEKEAASCHTRIALRTS